MKNLFYITIILFGILLSSCGTSRTLQIDNSKNSLYYHDAYWVAKIKPEGAPAKITVINDMHIDTLTNKVTVYAQSRILGKIVSPPQVGSGKCSETKKDSLCFHPNAVYLNGSGTELEREHVGEGYIYAFEEYFGMPLDSFYNEFDDFMLKPREEQLSILGLE